MYDGLSEDNKNNQTLQWKEQRWHSHWLHLRGHFMSVYVVYRNSLRWFSFSFTFFFYLWFSFETRRKRKDVVVVVVVVVVLPRQVSFHMFVCRSYLLRRVYIQEKEKNRERKKERRTRRIFDFLLLKYKIIIWPVHFFFSFFSPLFSLAYSCLPPSLSKILRTDYMDNDDDDRSKNCTGIYSYIK